MQMETVEFCSIDALSSNPTVWVWRFLPTLMRMSRLGGVSLNPTTLLEIPANSEPRCGPSDCVAKAARVAGPGRGAEAAPG
jgi:hypothetical protein